MEISPPDEVQIINQGLVDPTSNEKKSVPLTVETGWKKQFTSTFPVRYKLYNYDNISQNNLEQFANKERQQYEKFIQCFGQNNTAESLFVIGQDKSSSQPRLHLYQPELFCGKRSIEELNDPKVEKAIQNFYQSYIESVILGLVPDGIRLIIGQNNGYEIHNAGIYKSGDNVHIQVYDFNHLGLDLLTSESRNALKELLQNKIAIGEKPIEYSKIGHQDKIAEHLSEWYKEALSKELISSSQKKFGLTDKYDPNVDIKIIETILFGSKEQETRIVGTDTFPNSFETMHESLESFRNYKQHLR